MATAIRKRPHLEARHINARTGNGVDVLLEIPRNVHTWDGFHAWVGADEFPEKLRVTYVNGKVYLDEVAIPRDVHTLAGFRAWVHSEDTSEKLRASFLKGKVYLDMSREEIRSHALVKIEVGRALGNLNVEVDFGYLFIDGVLIVNVPAKVSHNPDGVAVLWRSLKRGRVRFLAKNNRETEIVGSPDWVMEILSNSSVTKDTIELRETYHRAKIGEYWLIDARGDEIDFQILHWRKAGYVNAPLTDGWQYSRAFRRSFRLVRRRDRLAHGLIGC